MDIDIYNEIEKHLNKKISKHKKQISKETYKVLAISEDYINKKFEHFFPLYIVKRSSLRLAIDMDMYSLPVEDLRLIEYLLENMDEEDILYIGSTIKDKVADLILRTSNKEYIASYDHITNEYNYYFKQNIYQGSISSDLSFINNLLLSLGTGKNNFKTETEELVYSYFLTNLSIMITSNLQKNDIYLFDNKYIAQTCETLENSIENYFKKFYTLFKDIINLFILNYNTFIEYLGRDNYIEFSQKVITGNIENIDSLIYLMYKNYLEYVSGITVDIETITKSLKKYKKEN